MNTLIKMKPLPFNNQYLILTYLFLVVTTLHLEIGLFQIIPLERILILGILGLFTLDLMIYKKFTFSGKQTLGLVFTSLFLMSGPLISSLTNEDYLSILYNEEYKGFVKVLLVGPILFAYFWDEKRKLLDWTLNFYFIFGLYFLYRVFILKELRVFDLRPTLNIRHGDPNFLCTFFLFMVPLALYGFHSSLNYRKYWYLFLSVFFVGCSVVTESRMGLISLMAAVFYLSLKIKWPISKTKIFIIFGLVGALYLGIFGGTLIQRFQNMHDKSNSLRVQSLENGVKLFSESPFFGVGWDQSWRYFYQNSKYPDFQSKSRPLVVHNTPLQLLAELGIYGLASFVFLIYVTFNKINKDNNFKHFSYAMLIILFFNSLTLGIAYKDLFILNFFILMALNFSKNIADGLSWPKNKPLPVN